MKIIFLDVDGVLNCAKTEEYAPSGYQGIDDKLVERLARIVQETGAEFVLASTWKDFWSKHREIKDEDAKYLVKKLAKKKLKIIDKSDDLCWNRGEGIRDYLKEHPEIKKYVILDDMEFDYKKQRLTSHLVHTNSSEGLTDADVQKAIRILSGKR